MFRRLRNAIAKSVERIASINRIEFSYCEPMDFYGDDHPVEEAFKRITSERDAALAEVRELKASLQHIACPQCGASMIQG